MWGVILSAVMLALGCNHSMNEAQTRTGHNEAQTRRTGRKRIKKNDVRPSKAAIEASQRAEERQAAVLSHQDIQNASMDILCILHSQTLLSRERESTSGCRIRARKRERDRMYRDEYTFIKSALKIQKAWRCYVIMRFNHFCESERMELFRLYQEYQDFEAQSVSSGDEESVGLFPYLAPIPEGVNVTAEMVSDGGSSSGYPSLPPLPEGVNVTGVMRASSSVYPSLPPRTVAMGYPVYPVFRGQSV